MEAVSKIYLKLRYYFELCRLNLIIFEGRWYPHYISHNIISRHQQKLGFTNSNDFVKYRTHKFTCNTHQLVQDAPSLQRFILQASTNQPELPKTKRPMQAFPAQINESNVENSPKNSGPSKLHSRYPQFALTSCTL